MLQPVTEKVTPPLSPARAHTVERQVDPDTPSPIQKPGRSRGRGTCRAPQKTAPGVGTRSKTRQAELEQAEATQAEASRAIWPPRPDPWSRFSTRRAPYDWVMYPWMRIKNFKGFFLQWIRIRIYSSLQRLV